MNSVILLLILASQFAIMLMLKKLLKRSDLSNEDARVKAMTRQVAEATSRLPKT